MTLQIKLKLMNIIWKCCIFMIITILGLINIRPIFKDNIEYFIIGVIATYATYNSEII